MFCNEIEFITYIEKNFGYTGPWDFYFGWGADKQEEGGKVLTSKRGADL